MSQTHDPIAEFRETRLTVVTDQERQRLLTDLLRGVSRAFYLTIRVLPRPMKEPVAIAYLLARAADTIADTRLLPPDERRKHLLSFREQLRGNTNPEALAEISDSLTAKQAIPKERELLQSLPKVFALWNAQDEPDRKRIGAIVTTLTQGMEMDLTTFPPEDSGQIVALKDWDELDRYTYLVAGCVGEFWTSIMMAHTPSIKNWDAYRMSEIGVRFGKALQMTNVLRDVPKDLRIGRCYLPQDELDRLGTSPDELLHPSNSDKVRPVLIKGIEITLEHYNAAQEYLMAIPRRHLRLRLAVLWPIFIGLGTLQELASNKESLEPERPSKVSRGWVYRMILLSLIVSRSNSLLGAWVNRLDKKVREAIHRNQTV